MSRRTALTFVVALVVVVTVMVDQGVLWPNRAFAARYDVRGLDVSHHNGRVDWPRVAEQDVDFV
ncbi:MAG: hypothetical protein J2O46_09590, partial [Nocardioides sp.]|nr:hypothetical protein [Nocardioides sp.]